MLSAGETSQRVKMAVVRPVFGGSGKEGTEPEQGGSKSQHAGGSNLESAIYSMCNLEQIA